MKKQASVFIQIFFLSLFLIIFSDLPVVHAFSEIKTDVLTEGKQQTLTNMDFSDEPADFYNIAGSQNSVSGGDSGTTKKRITSLLDQSGSFVLPVYQVTIPANNDLALEELISSLIRLTAVLEDMTTVTFWVTDWIYPMEGLDVPGNYSQTVNISTEDYTLAAGIPQTITIEITVTEATPISPDVITDFENLSHRYGYAIAAGSEWQEFFDAQFSDYRWEQSWPCTTTDGKILYAGITWENPKPDTSVPGIVILKGTPLLPPDSLTAEGLVLPILEVPISIQDKPTLECWYADADVISLPWVPGDLNSDSLRFYVSVNDGEFKDALEYMDTNGENICIWINYLEEGNTYRIKVAWDGGETNIFQFTWNGAVTDAGPYSGDRDGGDAEGNPQKPIVQPKPPGNSSPSPETVPDKKNESISAPGFSGQQEESHVHGETAAGTNVERSSNPEENLISAGSQSSSLINSTQNVTLVSSGTEILPEKSHVNTEANSLFYNTEFQEEVTDTSSLLSGTRLLLMKQNGPLRFSKNGITVTLSDDFTNSLTIEDNSRFFISIEKNNTGFDLEMILDDTSLSLLPGTVVQYPLSHNTGKEKIYLLNEKGEIISEGVPTPSLGIVTFQINAPGLYTVAISKNGEDPQPIGMDNDLHQQENKILEKESADLQSDSNHPSFFLITTFLIILGTAFFYLYYRYKEQNMKGA